MSHNLNNPYGTARPCRGCEHWAGDVPGTTDACYCLYDRLQVQANKRQGCVFWVRAIGADDEPFRADDLNKQKC
jgi:hypothetical protein